MTPDGRVIYPFLQCALEMGNTLCTTPEAHFLAKVISAFSADGTLAAWKANLESDSVANGEAVYLRANGHHRAGGFMAKR